MKIKHPDRKYFVMLLNKAAKTFGLKKPFKDLKRSDAMSIQDAVGFHVKQHKLLDDFSSTYAISTDRALDTYRVHLKKGTEEIPCNIKILNAVVHYATDGAIGFWTVYLEEKQKQAFKNQTQYTTSTEKVPFKERKRTEPLSVIIELPNADYAKEAQKDEWMIYELAFLWFGKEPPSIAAHFYQMTREMEALKTKLHVYVEQGLLKSKTISLAGGITRFISRQDLLEFLNTHNQEMPEFLKKDIRK